MTVGPYYHNVVVTVPGSDMNKGDRQHFHPDSQLPQLVFVFVYRPSLCLYTVRLCICILSVFVFVYCPSGDRVGHCVCVLSVFVFVYCPSLCLYTVCLALELVIAFVHILSVWHVYYLTACVHVIGCVVCQPQCQYYV